ncbi:MAG: hypothetical protein ABI193_00985 [Minicystis sp.]
MIDRRELGVRLVTVLVSCSLVAALSAPSAAIAEPLALPGAAPVARAAILPLEGNTYDFAHDAGTVHPERSFLGRAFLHTQAAVDPAAPLPVLVFLHGLNRERIEHRWMGGGTEGDLRRLLSVMMEAEEIPPMIVLAPSTTDPIWASTSTMIWPAFDLDLFLDMAGARLRGLATIDRSRIVLAGHSGAGCNESGGLATALEADVGALAVLAIDTCMRPELARSLARANPTTHVVVSWQSRTWSDRPFDDFRSVFAAEQAKAPPGEGVLRELAYESPTDPGPHDAMVPLTLRKWLPRILPAPVDKAADPDEASTLERGEGS